MKKSRQKFFGLIAAALLLIFFSGGSGWLAKPEAWLAKALSPLQGRFYSWGLNLSALKDYQKIKQENSRLKSELASLNVDYLKLSSLAAENQYLRKELDFLDQASYRFKLALVIGQLPLNNTVLIIDAGLDQGLKPGLAVTVNQGIIIGKISQAEANRAYVRLLSNPGSQLAVSFSQNAGSTNGLLVGQAGNSLLVELIPQSEPVAENQTVITSGLEELVPPGLLVGRVLQLEQRLGDIFKQARISPPFSYRNLNVLTVILKD